MRVISRRPYLCIFRLSSHLHHLHHCLYYSIMSPTKTSPPHQYWDRLNGSLKETDPEVYNLIEKEKERQLSGLEMIASENYTSKAVLECLGSVLTNKYSEGLPGARYYGGNEVIDEIENLCRSRALQAFHLLPSEWGCNVQPYSGSPANFAALTAILSPNDRLMGLDLPSGGHLTHGYQTSKKKISATSIYFQSLPYTVHPETGLIDYNKLEENARLFMPKVIIIGASAYPREFDYPRFRKIANEVGAYLMADIAHISGLVACKEAENPFSYCDIVTTTTHKTLRGPRSGIIFFRKTTYNNPNEATDLESRVNQAVFPGCQGGPHNNVIAGVATTLSQVMNPEFKSYCAQVKANTAALALSLKTLHGYKIVTDGTDNHLLLWDVRPLGLTGSKIEKVCEAINISVNKNTVCGDKSALNPGGVRLGMAALTSRGITESHIPIITGFLYSAVQISLGIQAGLESKALKDFVEALRKNSNIQSLRSDVETFSRQFPVPGL